MIHTSKYAPIFFVLQNLNGKESTKNLDHARNKNDLLHQIQENN